MERHIEAGFPKVAVETVRLRLLLLFDFLWPRELLTERSAASEK